MLLATAYWSLWVRIPAYAVGVVLCLVLSGWALLRLQAADKRSLSEWPAVFAFLAALLVPVFGYAYFHAWEERRVVAAFAESFIANAIRVPGSCLCLAAGAALGSFADQRFKERERKLESMRFASFRDAPRLRWLSWTLGILVAGIAFAGLYTLGHALPGVGWRMDQAADESSDDDYPGLGR